MDNRDTRAADAFHRATKYLAVRDAAGDEQFVMGEPPESGPIIGEQDPALEPLPYKRYTTLEPLELPRDFPARPMPALDALAATGAEPRGRHVPDVAALARLCLLSNGLLKRGSHGTGRVIEYRAAGGTGARYHLELYLVCGDLPGLAAGVYHYAADEHALRQLRAGDHRAALVAATGADPAIAAAPAVAAVTSTFWRNAWRYQARAYRHAYWDAGTTCANLLAVAASAELPATVVMGYADAEVNALLDVDGEREAAVALIALGRDGDIPAAPDVAPLGLPFEPYSTREIDFPAIPAMQRASSLPDGAAAAAWRGVLRRARPAPTGELVPLAPLGDPPADPIDTVIGRRRSVRHYDVDAPLPFDAFSTIVLRSSHGFVADCLDPAAGAPALHDQYLIVNNVEGLQPGVYVTHPELRAIELLRAGAFRERAARLAAEQQYAADAHVNAYYLTDLGPVLERFGNRGYRVAQLEAAIHAGKLHLAAHALGYGAVGSTSLDDEVIEFFSPHAAGKSYMFVLVFGKRRKRQA